MTRQGATAIRKPGRPRKIREDQPVEDVTVEETVTPVVKKTESARGFRIKGLGDKLLIPYTTKEDVKVGENHIYCNGNRAMGFKVIRAYRSALVPGLKKALEITLKPNKKTPRGYNDKRITEELKARGVQGIF